MLGNSITKFLKLDNLISNLTGYVETKVELVKVEVKEEVTKGISQAVVYLLIAFVFAMVLNLLSFGIAIALSNRIGPLAGFGAVAAVYVVAGIVLVNKRQEIIAKVKKELSKK